MFLFPCLPMLAVLCIYQFSLINTKSMLMTSSTSYHVRLNRRSTLLESYIHFVCECAHQGALADTFHLFLQFCSKFSLMCHLHHHGSSLHLVCNKRLFIYLQRKCYCIYVNSSSSSSHMHQNESSYILLG